MFCIGNFLLQISNKFQKKREKVFNTKHAWALLYFLYMTLYSVLPARCGAQESQRALFFCVCVYIYIYIWTLKCSLLCAAWLCGECVRLCQNTSITETSKNIEATLSKGLRVWLPCHMGSYIPSSEDLSPCLEGRWRYARPEQTAYRGWRWSVSTYNILVSPWRSC